MKLEHKITKSQIRINESVQSNKIDIISQTRLYTIDISNNNLDDQICDKKKLQEII